MEITFPVEFVVQGTPVSQNPKRRRNYHEWQARVKAASTAQLPEPYFATTARIAIVLYYLPSDIMRGDLDNIVKPILDALKQHVFVDDRQVDRILVQRFEPDVMLRPADGATTLLKQAWNNERPLLYVRISDTFDAEVV